MSGRLTIVSHAPTAATNTAAFPADEPLDARSEGWAAEAGRAGRTTEAGGPLGRVGRARCAPAPACLQTADALGLACTTEPLLRDWDLDRWRGRRLAEVAATEPEATRSWLTEPGAAPHGGESLTALITRAAGWLAAEPSVGHTVAITHPSVVRAVLVAALDAPAAAFWRIDIAPLTATVLVGGPSRWTVRRTGHPLRPGRDGGP